MQIELSQAAVGGCKMVTVNARELHAFLEVGKDFSNWIKDRIQLYGFLENQDFVIDSPNLANQNSVRGGDRRSKDYHLTLDMAKELAMVERNDKGREARRYFIACEKALREAGGQQSLLVQANVPAATSLPFEQMPIMQIVRTNLEGRIRAVADDLAEKMKAQIAQQLRRALCASAGVVEIGAMTNLQGQMAMEYVGKLGKGPVLIEMPNVRQVIETRAGQLPAVARLVK